MSLKVRGKAPSREDRLLPRTHHTKSVHMTFVHSCGNLGLLLSGDVLDRRRDLRGIIEMGEPVLPWAIGLHMPLDILHQIAEAFPSVVACALVVDITEDPLNGVGTWTVGR